MYELLVQLEKEIEYKKYTIKDLEEMKEILEGLKTESIILRRIKEK